MNKTVLIRAGAGSAECGLTDTGALVDSKLSITLFERKTNIHSHSFLELTEELISKNKLSITTSSIPVYNSLALTKIKHNAEIKSLFELNTKIYFKKHLKINILSKPEYSNFSLSKVKRRVNIKSFLTTLLLKKNNSDRKIYLYGDLRLFVENDEAEIKIIEVGPECDITLQTASLISVFTDSNWWGDFDSKNKFEGSNISKIKSANSNTRKLYELYIYDSLKWLKESGHARDIDVKVFLDVNKLSAKITIYKPENNLKSDKETLYWERTY